jgi:hypothetical protein
MVVFLDRFVGRICPAPGTDRLIEHSVALHGIRTTLGQDARRLVREMVGRIDNFVFQRNLMPNVLTIFHHFYLPHTLRHISLLYTLYILCNIKTPNQ